MIIFTPELADEDLTAQLDRVSGFITSNTGEIKEVLTDSPWGRRRLAYTVRFNGTDYRDGIYAVYHADVVPSAVIEIERELKLDVRTMRYLVVHDDPKAGEKQIAPKPESDTPDGAAPEAPTASTDAAAPVATDEAPKTAQAATEVAPEAAPASEEESPAAAVDSADTPAAADEPAPADAPVASADTDDAPVDAEVMSDESAEAAPTADTPAEDAAADEKGT